MKVILLCGYRSADEGQAPLGLEVDHTGKFLVDRRIYELQCLGFEVICVLSGDSADQILRKSKRLAEVELVFDTNGFSLASNLKAGLAATDGESCFVIPIEVPPPPVALWNFLRESLRTDGFNTKASVYMTQGALWYFPMLITRSGNELIKALPEFKSISDSRLNFVAPIEKPL